MAGLKSQKVCRIGGYGRVLPEMPPVFLCSSAGADCLVQVPLAGNVGILELLDPAVQLPGNTQAIGFRIADLSFQRGEGRNTFEETEHGADFTSGASGDVQKCQKFIRRAALEAFGDVVGDGQGGSFQLVA